MKIVVGYKVDNLEKLKVLHNSSVACLQMDLYNNYKTAGPFCLVKCRDGEIVSYEAMCVFTLTLPHSHDILLQAVTDNKGESPTQPDCRGPGPPNT